MTRVCFRTAHLSLRCLHQPDVRAWDSEYAHTYRDIQYRHPSSTVLVDGVPEIIRAVREQFYRGASHIKLMATEILNRHEDIRLLFGTDMMITGPDYQVSRARISGITKALRHNAGAEGFDGHCKRGVCTYDLPESLPEGKDRCAGGGSYADLLLVDGDPTKSVSVLADTDHLRLIMKGGTVYKNTLC